MAQNLVRRKDLQTTSSTMDTSNSTPSKDIPVTSDVSTSNGTKYGLLTVASAYKGAGVSYVAVNPWTGEKITCTENFYVANKCINDCLNIEKSEEEKRKATMKKKYIDLCKKLKRS